MLPGNTDHLNSDEAHGLAVLRKALETEGMTAEGRYTVECRGADGELKWTEEFDNLVVTVGKNYLLDTFLSGSAYTAAFYLSLVDGGAAPTYSAADTMASHAGWIENQAYTQGARPTVTWSAATGGAKASAAVAFTLNASATIAGCFLTTIATKGATTGTLVSAGTFSSGSRSGLQSGDQLSVTYTLSV